MTKRDSKPAKPAGKPVDGLVRRTRAYINDADARDCVALGSDFFPLEPGDCSLSFGGVSYFETRFRERWR